MITGLSNVNLSRVEKGRGRGRRERSRSVSAEDDYRRLALAVGLERLMGVSTATHPKDP